MGPMLVMEPHEQKQLIEDLQSENDHAISKGYQAVLLCGNQLRLPLRRLVEKYIPALHVLAYNEIASRADVEFVAQVKAAQAA